VPALLEAMKASSGEIRQRFEGCVSRIARDARHGIDRGALDVRAVERYLSEPSADLANIAAEAVGAAGPEGRGRLVAGLSRSPEAAACAWALGYAGDGAAGEALCAVLTAGGFPSAARANAARALGYVGAEAAAGPLAALIESDDDPAVQREAAWALALLGARDRDEAVATLLHSPDRETRCRAVIALAVLRSRELLGTGHMLASEDRNEAWIATWALFPAHVFDRHITVNRTWDDRGAERRPRYEVAKKFYRVQLDILDIEEAVPREEALKLLAEAAPVQKDEILKALMERIPSEQDGFEYQNRPFPPAEAEKKGPR
jgi:HEAT repeat protein